MEKRKEKRKDTEITAGGSEIFSDDSKCRSWPSAVSAQTFTWYTTNSFSLASGPDMKEEPCYLLPRACTMWESGPVWAVACAVLLHHKNKCMDIVPRVNLDLCLFILFYLFFSCKPTLMSLLRTSHLVGELYFSDKPCCLVQIVSFVLIIKETTRWSWCFLMHSSERVNLHLKSDRNAYCELNCDAFEVGKHKDTHMHAIKRCAGGAVPGPAVCGSFPNSGFALITHFSSTRRAINNWFTTAECAQSSRDGLCLQTLFY